MIRPGDRVFFEPGEEHWHGAAPDRFMAHLAMQEVDDSGSPVTWGEHVTDEEYGADAGVIAARSARRGEREDRGAGPREASIARPVLRDARSARSGR